MNGGLAGALAALALLTGCGPWSRPAVPAQPLTQAKPASGEDLDRQLVGWCLQQPDTSDQRCRCWPIALRAEGVGDAGLRELLIRLGALEGTPGEAPLDAAYETAMANCGLIAPDGTEQALRPGTAGPAGPRGAGAAAERVAPTRYRPRRASR